jgi:chromosome segregation ATPase
MSALELQRKQQQLDELQQSFDELQQLVESSKELEAELETALEEESAKSQKLAEAEQYANNKAANLQLKVDQLNKDLQRSSINGQSGDADEQNAKVRRLEIENENLQNQVRVLESTEEDLLHKLQNMEEDVIYLKSDVESLQLESGAEGDDLRRRVLLLETEKKALMDEVAGITAAYMAQPDTLDTKKEEHDKVQMLLFKQDKDIDFIKSTLNSIAEENWEHDHRHSDSPALRNASGRVEELMRKMAILESEHAEMAEQHSSMKLELEQGGHHETEDLRYHVTKQEGHIDFLNQKLRELEVSNEKLETKAKAPKFEQRGQFFSNKNTASSSNTATSVVHIDSTTTTCRHVTMLIAGTEDSGVLKDELLRLARQYDGLRNCNTRLLNKLQAVQGSIQVCCRTRPTSYQELAQTGNVCIDAADDNELMCYDG